NKIVRISLIAGILVISGFLIFLITNPEPGYYTFSILNEDQKMENYPTEASTGEPINFYVAIDNKLGKDFTFNVKILKGEYGITILNETGSYNAVLNFTIGNYTINNKQEWISPQLTISFFTPGEKIIIAELYEIKSIDKEEFLDINFLRPNITA
ncbi:MAG: DUF1616 domain-containing protein, partial [Candidatus Lokiarchaeota archaeon]|nr:DUF1616 domain-containing protein [Candidatus Lokiarchaeota archaeon]